MASAEISTIRSEMLVTLHRQGFRGMTIYMSSGEKLIVDDATLVGIGQLLGFIHPRDGSNQFFSLAQVSHVDVEPDVELAGQD